MSTLQQIPQDQLIEGRWYVGRGRNANVARWCRLGENPGRLTFLTIAFKFHLPNAKDEGYYGPQDGCFQPFQLIEEGRVAEPIGPDKGWDQHYAKTLDL